jgi:hypothetical protein
LERVHLYNQTILRYITRLKQYRQKPLGLVDIKHPPTPLPLIVKEKIVEKTPQSDPITLQTQHWEPDDAPPKQTYKLRNKIKSKIPTPKCENDVKDKLRRVYFDLGLPRVYGGVAALWRRTELNSKKRFRNG